MNELISPKYQMKLVKEVSDAIIETYKTPKEILYYVEKWHKINYYDSFGNYEENFHIYFKGKNLDIELTLHNISGEVLLKMAIDLDVETPDFIPSIPNFKGSIKSDYGNVYNTLVKSLKNIEDNPDIALGLINSVYESIIKEILKDERFSSQLKGNETLQRLTKVILKVFKFSDKSYPTEINTISSSLMAISQAIERLRSEKTNFHGKTSEDMIIEDPIYVYLAVNSVATVTLFLKNFYEKKYLKINKDFNSSLDSELPF
ncbi:abortive infection family protein [Ornithobacterium rhinotracheale]